MLSAILVCSDVSIYFLLRHYLLVLTDAALREELTELADEVGSCSVSELAAGAEPPLRAVTRDMSFEVSTEERRKRVFRSDGLEAGGPCRFETTRHRSLRAMKRLTSKRSGMLASDVDGPRSGGAAIVVQAAMSLAPNDRALAELLAVLLTTGPLALAVRLGGGYLLARKALAPVDHMAATAAEITRQSARPSARRRKPRR